VTCAHVELTEIETECDVSRRHIHLSGYMHSQTCALKEPCPHPTLYTTDHALIDLFLVYLRIRLGMYLFNVFVNNSKNTVSNDRVISK
jgi:hypothetical protein